MGYEENYCTECEVLISAARKEKYGLCNRCTADQLLEKSHLKLRLFSANLEADEKYNHKGFFVMLLAENLEQAKVFVQARFNIEYEGVIDVFLDEVTFTELDGPFNAGTILASLHY